MTLSLSLTSKRLASAVLAATAIAVLPVPASAQNQGQPKLSRPPLVSGAEKLVPGGIDTRRISPSGSYLAARHASVERDAGAAAAFYRAALRADPKNAELADRAFISSLAEGDIDEAMKLAASVLRNDKNNRVAHLVAGVHELKQKKYDAARANINQSVRGPITDLVATLLAGWASAGAGDWRGALAAIDKLQGPEWYPIFKDLHSGLIADFANRPAEAGPRLERVYKLDSSALRVVDAYGRWQSRNKDTKSALETFQTFDKALPRHPLIVDSMTALAAGKKLPPLVDTPQAGAAEALYGIGASLSRRGGEDLALVYLQLALYLQPDHPLALLSLADLYEQVKKPQLAISIYDRVAANSPLKRNARIQQASNLDAVDRSEEAVRILKELVAENPKDLEAISALGNVQRGRKSFADCADSYGKAIEALPDGGRNNWVQYYFRGICFERSKQWPKAEADLKKALELQPEQPQVLNYLGYSWVDQGVNLDDGMKMIRRAVDQRPDDGYIVDSLGWAYYRIGNYDEAVKHLERAIELKPEDPTINDHLGDAYWRVGRVLEARFQWAHARDLKADAEELPKIEAKLRDGLPDDKSSSASNVEQKKPNGG